MPNSESSQQDSGPTVDVSSPYTPRKPSPIVTISINHPIGTILRKIKNFLTHKQTLFSTTFTIKVTPIIAIVSFLGVAVVFGGGVTTAYQFGKTVEDKFFSSLPTPTPKLLIAQSAIVTLSRAGTVKATYQLQPTQVIPNDIGGTNPSSTSSTSKLPTPTPVIIHYILVSGSLVTYLDPTTPVNLKNYLGLRVLITGSLNQATNTLTVQKPSDIEILE